MSDGVSMSDVAEMHESQEAVDNTLRLQQEGAATTFSTLNADASFEYKHPHQSTVVYNLSSHNIPPFSEGDRPKIRISGLFPTADAAKSHGTSYFMEDDRCSIFQAETHGWSIALSCYPWDDAAFKCTESEYIEKTLTAYQQKLALDKDNFEQRMKDWVSVDGIEPEPQSTLDDATTEKDSSSSVNVTAADDCSIDAASALRFNADFKTVGQNFVVVSVVVDNTDGDIKMPLFKVYQAFDTEAEAGDYIRNCACQHVKDHDMFVAPMYTWLDLQHAEDAATVVHRENVLNKLAEGRKLEAAKIAQVKESQAS